MIFDINPDSRLVLHCKGSSIKVDLKQTRWRRMSNHMRPPAIGEVLKEFTKPKISQTCLSKPRQVNGDCKSTGLDVPCYVDSR